VLIGDALVNEDERLQARINQLHDPARGPRLKQSLRFALSEKQIPKVWIPLRQANLMLAFVVGRWHQFAKKRFQARSDRVLVGAVAKHCLMDGLRPSLISHRADHRGCFFSS